jgi:hypothetical protein
VYEDIKLALEPWRVALRCARAVCSNLSPCNAMNRLLMLDDAHVSGLSPT